MISTSLWPTRTISNLSQFRNRRFQSQYVLKFLLFQEVYITFLLPKGYCCTFLLLKCSDSWICCWCVIKGVVGLLLSENHQCNTGEASKSFLLIAYDFSQALLHVTIRSLWNVAWLLKKISYGIKYSKIWEITKARRRTSSSTETLSGLPRYKGQQKGNCTFQLEVEQKQGWIVMIAQLLPYSEQKHRRYALLLTCFAPKAFL